MMEFIDNYTGLRVTFSTFAISGVMETTGSGCRIVLDDGRGIDVTEDYSSTVRRINVALEHDNP